MIPLVLLDLDGTIIGSRGHVDDCVWKAVDKAQGAGMKFAVCTGRPCAGVAQKVAKRLGPNTPHIFQSGAQIAYASGEALKVFALPEASTVELVERARDLGLTLELYSPTTLFVERKTPLSEAHAKMIGVTPIVRDLSEVAENEPVIRAQWVVKPDDEARIDLDGLKGVQVSKATAPALRNVTFISLTQKDVSKGTATHILADTLKLDLRDVVGIGDSSGDVPMLDEVGFPVVMGDAPEDLKTRYGTVAGKVDACGVVGIIESALTQALED